MHCRFQHMHDTMQPTHGKQRLAHTARIRTYDKCVGSTNINQNTQNRTRCAHKLHKTITIAKYAKTHALVKRLQ